MSGKTSTAIIWNTSVLMNDMSADTRPLLSAVKNDEPNIAIPEKRKANEYILNQPTVRSKSPLS